MSGLPDLRTRADIDVLLSAFYGRALTDDLLGPVFAAAGMDLAEHLPRIGDFWEVSLLGTGSYTGRPMQLHRALVDRAGLAAPHFVRWLELWHATLDERFTGPGADRAHLEADRIGAGMSRAILDADGPEPQRPAGPIVLGR